MVPGSSIAPASKILSHLAWQGSDPTLSTGMQAKAGKQSKASKRSKKSKGKTGYRQRSKLRGDEGDDNDGVQQQTARPLTEMQAPQGVSIASTEEVPAEPEESKPSIVDEAAFEERLASLKADSSLLSKVLLLLILMTVRSGPQQAARAFYASAVVLNARCHAGEGDQGQVGLPTWCHNSRGFVQEPTVDHGHHDRHCR